MSTSTPGFNGVLVGNLPPSMELPLDRDFAKAFGVDQIRLAPTRPVCALLIGEEITFRIVAVRSAPLWHEEQT